MSSISVEEPLLNIMFDLQNATVDEFSHMYSESSSEEAFYV